MKKLSIIIPVFNEQATILALLNKLLEIKLLGGISKELVIVNDSSTDESEKLISLRNTLLPNLISGELIVSEIENLTEVASVWWI